MPAPTAPMSSGADTAPVQLDAGAFGLVNQQGDSVLLLEPTRSPTRITHALCADAKTYRVVYAHDQSGDPQHSSPETAANFANLTGELFGISSGAPSDETCYLTADSTLIRGLIPLETAGAQTCPANWLRTLALFKRQEVTKCWPYASGADSLQVLAAQFAPRGDSILASFVVFDRSAVWFEDFPAKYSGPDATTWRVDDEGVFDPSTFRILGLSQVRASWVMVMTWAGEEGEDAYVLVADSARVFRRVTSSYRYWMPG